MVPCLHVLQNQEALVVSAAEPRTVLSLKEVEFEPVFVMVLGQEKPLTVEVSDYHSLHENTHIW